MGNDPASQPESGGRQMMQFLGMAVRRKGDYYPQVLTALHRNVDYSGYRREHGEKAARAGERWSPPGVAVARKLAVLQCRSEIRPPSVGTAVVVVGWRRLQCGGWDQVRATTRCHS